MGQHLCRTGGPRLAGGWDPVQDRGTREAEVDMEGGVGKISGQNRQVKGGEEGGLF